MILSKLADHMKEQNMRAEDLASKTGLSFRTVVSAMKGKSVTCATSQVIAHVFRKKPADLE